MTDQSHTLAFLAALDGVDAIYDFRAMHDTRRDVPAIPLRGTFQALAARLTELNAAGYGIHVTINPMDGVGQRAPNVTRIRAQLLDLDKVTAGQQFVRACASVTPPHMVVRTSPGKLQCWFMVTGGDATLFDDNQIRLFTEYDGDPQFVSAAHTARLPGFMHCKAAHHLVTVEQGPAYGRPAYDPWAIAAPLFHVPVHRSSGARQPLGAPSLSAPSLDLVQRALWRIDPNALDRNDWIAITAATKQAGWLHGPDDVRQLWETWCSFYRSNDVGENSKNWNDIADTSAGWQALVKRSGLQAELLFGGVGADLQPSISASGARGDTPVSEGPAHASGAAGGSFLTPQEQSQYFRGCYWIGTAGRILAANGRLMDANKFNGTYGGKVFQLDETGTKTTLEPWQAALRGQVYAIPKLDHLRFVPSLETGAIMFDEFQRSGVNTYRRPNVTLTQGDVSRFTNHVSKLLPIERDREILFAFMAQCLQRPGVKTKWAVLIQSMEGAGKTIFRQIFEHGLGMSYVHSPNARELSEGGGKFNSWIQNKLMIICDEIRTDEKRDIVEVLKPMITDYRIEVQAKGQDQAMTDNPTNWIMFTNYKDAIPVNDASRRYAIFYSALQDVGDLARYGMDGDYFSSLYTWVLNGGASAVCEWLMRYPIPDEFDAATRATRAPVTSSSAEAVAVSRTWLESLIVDAVEAGRAGFRNGWVSSVAVNNLVKEFGQRVAGARSVSNALHNLGYRQVGKASRVFAQEFAPYQTTLYSKVDGAIASNYGNDQGYTF